MIVDHPSRSVPGFCLVVSVSPAGGFSGWGVGLAGLGATGSLGGGLPGWVQGS
jgi:hypothetical protein